jgi:hypothetical protein
MLIGFGRGFGGRRKSQKAKGKGQKAKPKLLELLTSAF